MFDAGSLTLFRVRGVPIRAHWSLLLVVVYLGIGLGRQFDAIAELAGVDDTDALLPPVVWGLLLATALFASIALHELAHTFVTTRFGGRVRAITLMLVGGVSELSHAPERPLHEALMALAGPAASFAIAATCFVLYAVFPEPPADLQMALFYLGAMNVSLGLFNLIPAFPMDGGRVVRAGLTAVLGRPRATVVAAYVGKVCAIGFAVVAIVTLNWSLGFVAVFIYAGAAAEVRTEQLNDTLAGLQVADLLPAGASCPVVPCDQSVAEMMRRMRALDRLEMVVVDRYGRPSAVLDADSAAVAIAAGRGDRRVDELAGSAPACLTVAGTVPVTEALEAAASEHATHLVVVDPPSGAVIGLVGPQDVARAEKLGPRHH